MFKKYMFYITVPKNQPALVNLASLDIT